MLKSSNDPDQTTSLNPSTSTASASSDWQIDPAHAHISFEVEFDPHPRGPSRE
jgi:polyisoprenoid-binding protein YceI